MSFALLWSREKHFTSIFLLGNRIVVETNCVSNIANYESGAKTGCIMYNKLIVGLIGE